MRSALFFKFWSWVKQLISKLTHYFAARCLPSPNKTTVKLLKCTIVIDNWRCMSSPIMNNGCLISILHRIKRVQNIKSLLYSLNTLSGVMSKRCPSPQLCARGHTSRLQQWRVVSNVWEIWSSRGLNPIPPAPEANVLPGLRRKLCLKKESFYKYK